ncbi:MAG: TetR family transcriptional regulator C-terminal domain-containing protein [Colwellia sp.]
MNELVIKRSKYIPRSRSRIRAANEEKILAEAENIFARFGFAGAKIAQIAKAVNISKTNLLYYYPNKLSLYQSVLQNIIDLWLDKLNLTNQSGDDPASKIENYIRDKMEISRIHPNASKVFANEIINDAPHIEGYLKKKLVKTLGTDVALVNSWIADGKMDPIDPYHMFFMIWASTQTYADFSAQIKLVLNKKELEKNDFEMATNFLCQVILKGLGVK